MNGTFTTPFGTQWRYRRRGFNIILLGHGYFVDTRQEIIREQGNQGLSIWGVDILFVQNRTHTCATPP